MKLQRQRFFGKEGDCFSTCLACILGIDTVLVPNFCVLYGDREWFVQANRWLAENFGIAMIMWEGAQPLEEIPEYRDHTTMIASGMGPRGLRHSVIWRGGEMIHDPHPSGAGLIDQPDEWEVFIVVDIERLKASTRDLRWLIGHAEVVFGGGDA